MFISLLLRVQTDKNDSVKLNRYPILAIFNPHFLMFSKVSKLLFDFRWFWFALEFLKILTLTIFDSDPLISE